VFPSAQLGTEKDSQADIRQPLRQGGNLRSVPKTIALCIPSCTLCGRRLVGHWGASKPGRANRPSASLAHRREPPARVTAESPEMALGPPAEAKAVAR